VRKYARRSNTKFSDMPQLLVVALRRVEGEVKDSRPVFPDRILNFRPYLTSAAVGRRSKLCVAYKLILLPCC
jgi:hypothetical protein